MFFNQKVQDFILEVLLLLDVASSLENGRSVMKMDEV